MKANEKERVYDYKNDAPIPDNWDWRTKGIVPPVSDQGQCGASAVYAEGDAVMAAVSIAAGRIISFDLSQIAECLQNGCNGAYLGEVYDYIKICGIPKSNTHTTECKYSPSTSEPAINGDVFTTSGNEVILANSLYTNGPHSVAIDASQSSFQFYSNGIYYDKSCSSTELDHEMLLIGYGQINPNQKYWILQNSWGKSWGMSGYIEMSRDRKNNCGIATDASYPTIGNNTFYPNATCYGN